MSKATIALAAASACVLASAPAWASLSISAKPTKNVSCSAGVCTATSKIAVLNVTDLENLLAASDVTVNAGSSAGTIQVVAPFAWSSSRHLALNADADVDVDAAISVQGTSGLTVAYNTTSGALRFSAGGKVDFWDTASSVSVNGTSYVLVNDLATLASDVNADPLGAYALAKDYDAGPDGTYEDSISNVGFGGALEGLGHTVSNLSIHGGAVIAVGMFALAGGNTVATIRDMTLANVGVHATGGSDVGALVGNGFVDVFGVSSSGTIDCGASAKCGGLIGVSEGGSEVEESASSASVTAGVRSEAGGLIGFSQGDLRFSQASGTVFAMRKSDIGGLAGVGQSAFESFASGNASSNGAVNVGGLFGSVTPSSVILDCYATGAAQGGALSRVGGLIGNDNEGSFRDTYSAGAVSLSGQAPAKTRIGGAVGKFLHGGVLDSVYWDIDTSGQSAPCGTKCAGFTGISDAALKSGLPGGLDPSIWAQSPSINNGYPYLIANPPR
ncbi:MAG TPA: hypothetical protein VFV07_12440 [Rhizomicrobium sp.]|nr:hypothetical protein [Rhizomicrobium sp.]